MKTRAFVPGHITGFFEIMEHSDPLLSGSRGCGVVIDRGVTTTVEVEEAHESALEVRLDGAPCDCPVTQSAVEMLRGFPKGLALRVNHELQPPMKYGFGISAAGALGVVLALNRALGLGMSPMQCGQIAHRAEIVNKTGLGDVIAELKGGLLLRSKPGAPGIGEVEKIACDYYVVVFLVGEELETKPILRDEDKKKRINNAGGRCMELFTGKPTPKNFLETSRKFTLDTGLMSKKVYLAMKILKNHGVIAAMTMLGNAVFTLTDSPQEVSQLLDYPCIIAKIDNIGARIIEEDHERKNHPKA